MPRQRNDAWSAMTIAARTLDTSVYKSGPSKTWIKVKNPKAPAATRVIDGTF
jgi:hypothetical protein